MKMVREYLRIQATCADINGLLKRLTEQGIELADIKVIDELTICFSVLPKDRCAVLSWLKANDLSFTVLKNDNDIISKCMRNIRPVLLTGILMLSVLSFFLSGMVLFVEVTGNERIPAAQIVEQAADCGIAFGAKSREINSENIKNRLLEEIPDLKWAGVTLAGSVAKISVKENDEIDYGRTQKGWVTSIISSSDGIVDAITVTSGNPVCVIGQAVTKGQTLISGYTDCGILIKTASADGEVYAKTLHNMSAIVPTERQVRTDITEKRVYYSIKFGKKLINFNKGSGISPSTCVKMVMEYKLRLPGGRYLPVSIAKQEMITYDMTEKQVSESAISSEQLLEEYLLSNLISGTILQSNLQTEDCKDHIRLNGKYLCREMVGRIKTEQAIQGVANSG